MDNKTLKLFEAFNTISTELKSIIIGKEDQIDKTLICLLAQGHLLLEDMPGVGKTSLASALASAIGGTFSRIQFTSDLLPFDIIGTKIYKRQSELFEFIKGPIFSNVILADELNRASPKTQSALLQAMNELAVSFEKQNYVLENPFFVIATQNPCGSSGTYPLPESELDRFMMRISLGYPDSKNEKKILIKNLKGESGNTIKTKLELEQVIEAQNYVSGIEVDEKVLDYIVRLSTFIKEHNEVLQPVSPRGNIALMKASQAVAFMKGKDYVSIDMVKSIAPEILGHRVGLKNPFRLGDRSASADWINSEVLQKVNVE
jgi:MoxR-like ATPase